MLKRLFMISLSGLFLFSNTGGQNPWNSPLQNCWNFPLSEKIALFASDNDSILISSLNQLSLISDQGHFLWNSSNQTFSPIQIQINGDRIFELSYPNGQTNQLIIKSLSKQTGLLLWQRTIATNISKDNLPVFSIDRDQVKILNNNELIQLDLSDGSNLRTNSLVEEFPQHSTLMEETAYLFLGQNKINLYSTIDGKLLRSFQTPPGVYNSWFFGNFTILSDTKGQIFALEKDKELWTTKLGGEISSFHFNQKNVAIASNDNYFYQFSQKNGRIIWKKRFPNRIFTAFSPEYNIFAVGVNNEGRIEILGADDGKTINQITLAAESLPRESEMLIKDKILVIFGQEKIQAFSPEACK